jgi:hypothetical protein
MGGSITGEVPRGKAACSEVYFFAFSSPRRTMVQVRARKPRARLEADLEVFTTRSCGLLASRPVAPRFRA